MEHAQLGARLAQSTSPLFAKGARTLERAHRGLRTELRVGRAGSRPQLRHRPPEREAHRADFVGAADLALMFKREVLVTRALQRGPVSNLKESQTLRRQDSQIVSSFLRSYAKGDNAEEHVAAIFALVSLPAFLTGRERSSRLPLIPAGLVRVFIRKSASCVAVPKRDRFDDALDAIARTKGAMRGEFLLSFHALIAPAISREAYRAAVAAWHRMFLPLFWIWAVIWPWLLGFDWWQAAIGSVVAFATFSYVPWLITRLKNKVPSGPTGNFVLNDYAKVIAYASLGIAGLSIALSVRNIPLAGVGVGLTMVAAWTAFSYLWALYGARGQLGGTKAEVAGMAGVSMLNAWHSLNRHSNAQDASTSIAEAGGLAARYLRMTAAAQKEKGSRERVSALAWEVEQSLLDLSAKLAVNTSPKSRQRVSLYLERCMMAIAQGNWVALKKDRDKVRKGARREDGIGRRLALLIVRLIPVATVAILFIVNPTWLEGVVPPIVIFVVLATFIALVDFLFPRARAGEAMATSSDVVQFTGLH